MKYTLSVLVENRPGVLARVVSLFARRGYNIDALTVGASETPGIARMTLSGEGDNYILEQMEKQLNKIVPVIKVRSLGPEAMRSELMLLKLNCDPPSFGQIHQIATLMDAQVVQVTRSSVTLRFAGSPEQCDTLFELTRPFGVKEVARSGVLAVD